MINCSLPSITKYRHEVVVVGSTLLSLSIITAVVLGILSAEHILVLSSLKIGLLSCSIGGFFGISLLLIALLSRFFKQRIQVDSKLLSEKRDERETTPANSSESIHPLQDKNLMIKSHGHIVLIPHSETNLPMLALSVNKKIGTKVSTQLREHGLEVLEGEGIRDYILQDSIKNFNIFQHQDLETFVVFIQLHDNQEAVHIAPNGNAGYTIGKAYNHIKGIFKEVALPFLTYNLIDKDGRDFSFLSAVPAYTDWDEFIPDFNKTLSS